MLAVDQFDANGAEPVEVVVSGGLARMGGVDTREDDHRHGGDALAQDGQGLVVGDTEGELDHAVGRHRCTDEYVALGMGFRLVRESLR